MTYVLVLTLVVAAIFAASSAALYARLSEQKKSALVRVLAHGVLALLHVGVWFALVWALVVST